MTVAHAVRIAVLAAAYFAAAKLGLAFAFVAPQVTPVWPPTGIALAALLVMGPRLWPGVALGAFLANLTAHEPVATAAGIATGNTLEAVVAAALLRRVGFRPALDRIRDVVALGALGSLASTTVSATIGVTSLCMGGVHPWTAFLPLWWLWWIGDAMGDVVMAPLLLVWARARPSFAASPRRVVEGLILLAALAAVAVAAFTGGLRLGIAGYPLHYTVFPLVVYAALRFGQHGATAATFTTSAIAIWNTVHGWGPLAAGTTTERVVMLLFFLAVVAATALLLAAAMLERNTAERRRAAGFERLEEGEQRLRLALEAGRMGVWDWNVATGEVRWSENLETIHGLAPGSFPGNYDGFLALVHPDDRARVEQGIGQALEHGRYDIEFRNLRPDGGEHWLAASGTVLRDSKGRPVRMLGVGTDVTVRHRLEEQLTQRAGALADADRRKDVFLAMLAHELRAPLAPIGNALHLLRDSSSDHERALAIAERQVKQLARLVDDLLDVSRITRGKIELCREPVALGDVVSRAVETTRAQTEGGGQALTIELPAEPVWLDADAARLSQVLANLLGNAAKYTPRGGSIRLSAAREDADVVIRVRDTGPGIPADLLPHVFDLFVQGDTSLERTRGGLGVGLTIVRQLLELHGGRVEVRSPGVGAGSEFVVTLPTGSAPVRTNAATGISAPSKDGSRTVLLVEDNVDAADSLAGVLETWGHAVRVAGDGPSALAEIETRIADVILSDLGLPGMDGYELARRIRAHPNGQAAVLIALSGYGQAEDRALSLAAGFDHHLVKPPDLDVLAELLARPD